MKTNYNFKNTFYQKFILIFILFASFGWAQYPESLWTVDGKSLKDDCGENIVLKGLNHGNIYDVPDFGVGETAKIALTGANALRIVVDREYCTYPPPNYTCVEVPTTAAQLTTMIEASLANKMIPIVELHDFTGSQNPAVDLVTAANWWVQ